MTLKNALFSAAVLLSTMANATNDPATDQPFYNPEPPSNFPYDMTYPYAYFELDDVVKKISGLSSTNDPKVVAGIQEEEGKIYMIDKKSGKIASSTFFVTEGEFQAIEMVGNDAYALKSNGQLYKISNLKGAQRTVKMLKTNLPRTANLQGLAYDIANNRLLICAKGQKEGEFSRQIYAFDVITAQTNPEPVYEISLASFKEFLSTKKEKQYLGLRSDYVEKASTKGFDFAPTSVAINPMTGNLFVLSALNNTLITMNPQGEIIEMTKLKKEHHLMPEGIAFDEEGTMFIANSSINGVPAKLYEYKMQKTAITASRK
jgi:uncharacterized protein YjiK